MRPTLLATLALTFTALPLQAAQEGEVRYLLGGAVSFSPEYDGASRYAAKFRPVWAVKFGRVLIASGGGSALLGFGRGGAGPGASTQLLETERWRVGLSLRLDGGRDSGDADSTRGLPDVKRTVRARAYVNYSLATDWNLGASLSQDALGRGGGIVGSLDLGWRLFRSESTEWTSGIGLTGGNARNLRSYFGVPDAGATPARAAYRPGAGLRDAYIGMSVRHALDKHWFVFGSAGVSRLLGPAADSPLVQRASSQSMAVGLAWRN
jgi:outer membrane scaffolding protein for murein synthesis (MipA/OmpV family)